MPKKLLPRSYIRGRSIEIRPERRRLEMGQREGVWALLSNTGTGSCGKQIRFIHVHNDWKLQGGWHQFHIRMVSGRPLLPNNGAGLGRTAGFQGWHRKETVTQSRRLQRQVLCFRGWAPEVSGSRIWMLIWILNRAIFKIDPFFRQCQVHSKTELKHWESPCTPSPQPRLLSRSCPRVVGAFVTIDESAFFHHVTWSPCLTLVYFWCCNSMGFYKYIMTYFHHYQRNFLKIRPPALCPQTY